MDESVKEGEGCDHCRNKKHVIYDEVVGKAREEAIADPARFEGVEKIQNMTADERDKFWKAEFSRCIRCNACRDVCPACTCEKCVFDNNNLYTSQKVAQVSFEESLYHIIRAWHVAGRCTDCGECSRVCPEHIPLHLLNRKFVKDIDEIYGPYIAGSDMETKPPMLTWTAGDAEPSVVYERSPEEEGGED
jgi:ferredoxin